MKRFSSLILIMLLFMVYVVSGQKVNKKVKGVAAKTVDTAVKVEKPVPVYLGRSDYRGGKINKSMFDSLIKQGLTSRDSLGTKYNVNAFTITYAERNLYEDSVGNLTWITDFLSERCIGDTLSPAISNTLYDRTKAGDTVYFENISVQKADVFKNGKAMKFELTK